MVTKYGEGGWYKMEGGRGVKYYSYKKGRRGGGAGFSHAERVRGHKRFLGIKF